MKDNVFRDLLDDKILIPNKRFERSLRKRLVAAPRRSPWLVRAGLATASVALGLTVFGLSVLQPASDTIGQSILLKELYASALAAEPSGISDKATFWRLDRTQTYGSAAATCAGYDPDGHRTEHRTVLVYDDKHTSALLDVSDLRDTYQRFSSDGDVSAAAIKDFQGMNDTTVWGVIGSATLVDAKGNPLPANARTPQKTSGTYDLYATYAPAIDSKDYTADCERLMIHVKVDAATNMFRELSVYRSAIKASELSFTISQTVQASSESFAAVEPQFAALGFNKDEADLSKQGHDYTTVENKAAGYVFSYRKSIYGKMHVKELKDKKGAVSAWHYTFSAQPSVVFVVRAGDSPDSYPQSVAELSRLQQARGWTVESEYNDTFPSAPTLGHDTPQHTLVVSGDGRKRIVSELSSAGYSGYYLEASDSLKPVTRTNKYAPNYPYQDDPLRDLSLVAFPVGGSLPQGH